MIAPQVCKTQLVWVRNADPLPLKDAILQIQRQVICHAASVTHDDMGDKANVGLALFNTCSRCSGMEMWPG